MNHLTTPPERELPDQQRRRAELLLAISEQPASSRRRVLVPVAAGVSVLGLMAGGTIAGQSLLSQDELPVQGAGNPAPNQPPPSGPAEEKAPSEKSAVRPAPPVHDLTPAEQATALEDCVAGVPDWQGFEPVLGVRFDESEQPKNPSGRTTSTFLVAQRGDDRLYCTFDQKGNPGDSGLFGSSTGKDIPYLFAPVDGKGDGFGMYTTSVAKVTLQRKDGPERAAVLRDGYWFLPLEESELPSGKGRKLPPAPDNSLIGVPADHTIRGYDQSGELVYDSDEDGPGLTCYTDPEGEEVLVHNGVDGGNPSPQDCRRTVEWKP